MSSQQQQQRIKRPDVSVRDKKLETLNVQLKKIDEELNQLRKQIDQNQVNDKTQNERKKLQEKTKEIIKTQADLKARRNAIHDSIKQLDSQIKRRTGEIQDRIGKKSKYTTTAEAKQRINQIEDQISTGDMSLVEEKMLVKELNSLNKLIKDLVAIDPIKKAIDTDKDKIVKLKEELSGMNSRELSAQFDENQKRLNELQSSTQTVFDKRQTLYNKRTALYKKRDEVYSQIRKIRADFDNEFKAFKNKLEKQRLKREEEEKLSKVLEEKDAKLGKLQEKLTHARIPAFTYEIEAIENTLVILDPTFEKPKKNVLQELENGAAEPVMSNAPVNNDGLVLVEKKDDSYNRVAPSKSKKHKKKSQSAKEPSSQNLFTKVDGKITLEPTLIATLAELDVTVPITQDDVATSVEQLKKKLEEFKSNQDEQTEKNIKALEEQMKKLELAYEEKENEVKRELEEKRQKEKEEEESKKENEDND